MWLFGKTEGFVNEPQARSDIITTFITISIVFFGMVVAFLLLWAYNKSDKLFFMVFCGMVTLYTITMIIFVAIIRSNITSTQFKIFMIVSTFMAIMSIFILIIFVVKSSYLFKNIDIRNKRSPVEDMQEQEWEQEQEQQQQQQQQRERQEERERQDERQEEGAERSPY